jgi:hypothetical protein
MIREDLFYLQQNFKCNKDSYNEFGKFKYRNLEQILFELKPLLAIRNCTITFENDMVNLGNRYYIKSTCILQNMDGETTTAIGWAREDESRAGMSESQSTGCAMSYANKYSICLLLAISEELDPDSMDNGSKQPKISHSEPSKDNITLLTEFCSAKKLEIGVDINQLTKFYNYYSTKDFKGRMDPESLWERWIKPKAN